MLVSVGHFVGAEKCRKAGITGLLIDFNYTTNWCSIKDVAILNAGIDVIPSMAASSQNAVIITGFDDLSPGQMNTDSDYNANVKNWPTTAFPGELSPHWSDSGSSSMKVWFKFAAPVVLTGVRIYMQNVTIYGFPPNILFSDQDGVSLIPMSAPSGINDYLYINGSNRAYEWIFNI